MKIKFEQILVKHIKKNTLLLNSVTIAESGSEHLSFFLNDHPQITSIDLGRSNDCLKAVIKALKNNKTIKLVNFTGCKFKFLEMQALNESLANNNTLQSIDFTSCNFYGEAADEISELLRTNKSLTTLNFDKSGFIPSHELINALKVNFKNGNICKIDMNELRYENYSESKEVNSQIQNILWRNNYGPEVVNHILSREGTFSKHKVEMQNDVFTKSIAKALFLRFLKLTSEEMRIFNEKMGFDNDCSFKHFKEELKLRIDSEDLINEIFEHYKKITDQIAIIVKSKIQDETLTIEAIQEDLANKPLGEALRCFGEHKPSVIELPKDVDNQLKNIIHYCGQLNEFLVFEELNEISTPSVPDFINGVNNEFENTLVKDGCVKEDTLSWNWFSNSNISDIDIESLFKFLNKNPHITKLNLDRILPNLESLKALAENLKNNTTLKSLSLMDLAIDYTPKSDEIGSQAAEYISEALKINTTLESLSFCFAQKQIGDKGIKCLAEALAINNSLTHLDLGSTDISVSGKKNLINALKENTGLIEFKWNYHKESEESCPITNELKSLIEEKKMVKFVNQILELSIQDSEVKLEGNTATAFAQKLYFKLLHLTSEYMLEFNKKLGIYNDSSFKFYKESLIKLTGEEALINQVFADYKKVTDMLVNIIRLGTVNGERGIEKIVAMYEKLEEFLANKPLDETVKFLSNLQLSVEIPEEEISELKSNIQYCNPLLKEILILDNNSHKTSELPKYDELAKNKQPSIEEEKQEEFVLTNEESYIIAKDIRRSEQKQLNITVENSKKDHNEKTEEKINEPKGSLFDDYENDLEFQNFLESLGDEEEKTKEELAGQNPEGTDF